MSDNPIRSDSLNSQPNVSNSKHSTGGSLQPTQNLNVEGTTPLIVPRDLEQKLPMSARANEVVVEGRTDIRNILRGEDRRFLVVIGPCSIHDVTAAKDYAARLAALREKYIDRLYIVMRVYFEKPRTTVGWKGLINDPHLDGTFDIEHGLHQARDLLCHVTELGLPTATEVLDPITPQYIDDLLCWAAIGARTTESQTHRQMASGLSMPVGFKNSTDGNLQVAIDAMQAAKSPHRFLGIDEQGRTCIVATRGNADGHVILRGGTDKTNYEPDAVAEAVGRLKDAGVAPGIMVDCSHANSGKKFTRQEVVWNSIIEQRATNNENLVGAMVESFIGEGNQKLTSDQSSLEYGVSITDECIGWEKTEQLLREGYEKLGG